MAPEKCSHWRNFPSHVYGGRAPVWYFCMPPERGDACWRSLGAMAGVACCSEHFGYKLKYRWDSQRNEYRYRLVNPQLQEYVLRDGTAMELGAAVLDRAFLLGANLGHVILSDV